MHDRRDFLGTLMALGAAPVLAGSTAFRSTRDPASSSSDYDVTWAEKLTGKHRAVFDCVEISMGLGLLRALVWQKDYASVYGARPEDLSAVVVLRHNAIWQAMDDEFWAHHKIGELTRINDPATRKPITRNPFFGANLLGLPAEMADDSLRKVLGTSTVLACDLAFTLEVVEKVKADSKSDDAKAREMALHHLVPGVKLQPSGVFAALRAQEAGCHYLLATDASA
jgi:hypothetical protein